MLSCFQDYRMFLSLSCYQCSPPCPLAGQDPRAALRPLSLSVGALLQMFWMWISVLPEPQPLSSSLCVLFSSPRCVNDIFGLGSCLFVLCFLFPGVCDGEEVVRLRSCLLTAPRCPPSSYSSIMFTTDNVVMLIVHTINLLCCSILYTCLSF